MKNLKYACLFLVALISFSCANDDDYVPNEADTQSPSAPLNLIANDLSDTSAQLSWEASTDNVGVTGYNIYQDGTIVAESSGTSVTISDLTPETAYAFYVTAEDAAGNESNSSNVLDISTVATPLEFLPLLSQMGIFQGDLADLNPAEGVYLYEISSTLFTDYASKPRHIKLPEGTSMEYNNSDLLPSFPDNTIISKTFYYNIDDRDPSLGRQIIETRLLLKTNGTWSSMDYLWNSAQTEATMDMAGGELPISYIDINGDTQNVDYQIPSNEQCAECHNNNGQTFPIGLKLRNLNFVPSYTTMNQLDYLTDNGLLDGVTDPSSITALPIWWDEANFTLDERARAYMDINCAHCHSPGGSVPPTYTIDLRYETAYESTDIYVNRGEIEARFESTTPLYRMPLIGRTVVHDEALTMLVEYLESL